MKTFFRCVRFLVLIMSYLLAAPLYESSAQTERGGGIPLDRLPKELRDLSPRDHFIPSQQKKAGVVHALEGNIVVIHGATKEAYFGRAGDPVYEKDTLITLSESKCRIRFLDEDVVTMAPDTEFRVEGFEDQRAEGRKTSFFSMIKGRAMFYALRLFRYRDTRFTLATPTNTIGVRGTKFGAYVYYLEDSKTASALSLVADANNEIAPYLAQAGTGQSFTDCFSEDGVLDVDGKAVSPGQMFSGRTGEVIPTPPEVIRSFQQATEIRTEGAKGEAPEENGETTAPPPPPTAVTGGVAPLVADIQADITSVVQVQGGQQVEKEIVKILELPPDIPPRKDIGYFAAMLTNADPGAHYLEDVFIQFEDHRQYETDTATGLGLADSNRFLEGRPNFTTASPLLNRVYLGSAGDSGDLGDKFPISDTVMGRNDYMQWGYWTMTSLVHVGGEDFTIDNKAYYLVGQATDNIDKLKNLGEVSYSGSAWGTYFSETGGYDLTGGFTANVNLNSGSISNFALSAANADSTRYVSISGASGSIYGYDNPDAVADKRGCSHFDIHPGTGTWILFDGSTPVNAAHKAAQGALYGPNAEHMGGIWGMYNSSDQGAVGGFQGSRPK